MRLFIAIKPNNALLEALKAAQEELRAAGVAGNYTKPQNLHITLAFIGEYPDPARVLRVMREVPFAPLEISLCGTGSFKGVFWAGIKEKGGLAACASRLRGALAASGIPFDKKPFSPHITIVREPHGELPPGVLQPAKMLAQRVSLYKSERVPGGMIYTELGFTKAE